ncbi:hypothetical protein SDC9_204711 [bioreactor metagenome]|uniref:Uncharacterized protein n=1 Tax=bioreactor metagenome TaxID=1076179 RepID=A0A645J0T5_9ZZZZ
MACMAGGTVTWETNMEKFFKLSALAWMTLIALAGAVVSKPMAKKTTSLSGLAWAILTASIGE